MKDLKFKVWNKKKKLMSDPFLINHLPARYKKKGNIFIQYAGVKDKSGKEVYWGDIVRHERIVDHHDSEVFYEDYDEVLVIRLGHVTITPSLGVVLNGSIKMSYVDGDEIHEGKYNKNPGSWDRFAEVIGNIYQNPEMLTKKEGE